MTPASGGGLTPVELQTEPFRRSRPVLEAGQPEGHAPTLALPTPSAAQDKQREPDYENPEKCKALAERCLERARANTARKARDRQDLWNLKLYRGGEQQWDAWNPNTERFEQRGTDPEKGGIPAYVPRNTSNHFAHAIEGIASILDQTDPAKEFGPGSDDDADRAASEVAADAVPVLYEEMGYERDRAQIHLQIALTSGVAYSVYYDNDKKHGMSQIVAQQCLDCGEFAMPDELFQRDPEQPTCPACGSPNIQDAIDPQRGIPLAVPFPIGKLCARAHSSFEFSLPNGARTHDTARLPWVLTHARWPVEEIIAQWPKLKAHLTAQGSTSRTPGDLLNGAYADQLSGLVAPLGAARGADGSGGRPAGPIVFTLYHDPIEDDDFYFPDGLYLVLVDGELGHAGPLEFKDEQGRPFKNILIRQYRQAPGNAAGKPAGDDLDPLQVQRNIISSLHDLALMHYASPREYIPVTATLLDEPTGAPGERIRYRSTVPGEVPTTVEGKAPAMALAHRLEMIDAEFDKLSKLNAVLAGERPKGDPTLGEVSLLREQGQSMFRAPLDELCQFEIDLARLALRVASQTMWTERFYKIRGDNGAWEVKQFLGADLAGRVDIYIDKASAWPKSPLLDSLRLKEGFETGLLPTPAAADPEFAAQLASELNLARFKPTLDKDRKQIGRELELWKTATDPAQIPPPDPLIWNVPLHLALKKAWLKTEEAEAAQVERPEVYKAMRIQLEQLQGIVAAAQAAQAAAAAGVAPGGPAGDPLDELTRRGVLKPTGQQGTGVGDLVDKGVLRPAPSSGKATTTH